MNHKIKLLALTFTLFALPAWAEQNPRPLGSDPRIRHVLYSPNEVYEVKATYGYQTSIELSDQEVVQVASIGDSIAWQIVPAGNRVFLKPVEQNARTNLTVVTNKRTYYFQLSTGVGGSPSAMTYLVRFEYPKESFSSIATSKAKSPAEYNFSYELKKGKKSGLIRAFDNGEFTYLQFNKLEELPTILVKNREGQESIANYRIEGPYVVIEKIAPQFLFRKGKKVGELINKGFSSVEAQTFSSQGVPRG